MQVLIYATFTIRRCLSFFHHKAYDEAISLDNSAVLFRGNKAAVYIEMNEPDTAIKVCEEAVEVARSQRTPYPDIAKV